MQTLFKAIMRVPKDEKVEEADAERRKRLIDIAMANIERLNAISQDAYENGNTDDASMVSDLCGDWYDRLVGRRSNSD